MKCSWFQTCSNSPASFTASSGNQFVLHHVLEDIWVFVIEYVMLVNMPDTSNLAEPKLLNSTLMSGCSRLWYHLYVYSHIATIYILIWMHFLRDMFVESITLWFQWVPLFPIKTISEGLCCSFFAAYWAVEAILVNQYFWHSLRLGPRMGKNDGLRTSLFFSYPVTKSEFFGIWCIFAI